MTPAARPAIEARNVVQHFGEKVVLDGVSLRVSAGSVHGLIGANGAGKTTLTRILAGLLVPTDGSVRVLGVDGSGGSQSLRSRIGFVPGTDRTFYLRISGLENLVFFARLCGLRRARAVLRAMELLEVVGLSDAARMPVGKYSHGMQKRLSIARALLMEPPVMLVDEATHDLDPVGAQRVRELVADQVERGAAVLWTTQRMEELRGFAQGVSILDEGKIRFEGSISELIAQVTPRRYVVRVRSVIDGHSLVAALNRCVEGIATVTPVAEASGEHFVLLIDEAASLGEAITAMTSGGIRVLGCHEQRSEIEEAFLYLTAR